MSITRIAARYAVVVIFVAAAQAELGAAKMIAPAVAAAADKTADIHLPATKSTGFCWQKTDGAGFRWDLYQNGNIDDGTNDAYDGGMNMVIAGNGFYWSSNGRLSDDGNEIEVGPYNYQNVRISRRIYVDPKLGYCRWIDIFENAGGQNLTITVDYRSVMGGGAIQSTKSTLGKDTVSEKDWGCATYSANNNPNRPAVAHVFAARNSKLKPTVRCGVNSSSEVAYSFRLDIPANKAVALCVFEAQRKTMDDAQKFLKDFSPRTEIGKLPPALREIIANISGSGLSLGNIDLPASDQHDMIVLANGDELLGKVEGEQFQVQTTFGKLDLPAKSLLGMLVTNSDDPRVMTVLRDGQVVCGELLSGPIKIKLADGNSMSLTPDKIKSMAYKLAEQQEELVLKNPMLIMRSGERLSFKPEGLDCAFQSEYGQLALRTADLRLLYLDTPDNGLHRAVFTNGSIVSGLMTAAQFKLQLELGQTLTVKPGLIERIEFPGPEADTGPMGDMRLRNEDVLLGKVVEKTLQLQTTSGDVTIQGADIAEVNFLDTAYAMAQIKLHNGSTVSGKLLTQRIAFQITPGPQVSVFAGHVVKLTCPKPPPTTTSAPTSGPTSKPADKSSEKPSDNIIKGGPAESSKVKPSEVDPAAYESSSEFTGLSDAKKLEYYKRRTAALQLQLVKAQDRLENNPNEVACKEEVKSLNSEIQKYSSLIKDVQAKIKTPK